MVGYLLMVIGAWLVYDDVKNSKRNKIAKVLANAERGVKNAELHKNGFGGSGSDSGGKPSSNDKESDRNRGVVTPIGVPVQKKKVNQGVNHELHKEPVKPVGTDKGGDSNGNHSNRKPNASTPNGDQGESLEEGQDAGNQEHIENDVSDDGDDVRAESVSINESNGAQAD